MNFLKLNTHLAAVVLSKAMQQHTKPFALREIKIRYKHNIRKQLQYLLVTIKVKVFEKSKTAKGNPKQSAMLLNALTL